MKTLYILTRTHSDYDEHYVEVVGVTEQAHIANAFLDANAYDMYWSHGAEIVTLNVIDTDVHRGISEWLDPATNPTCECGHKLLHHRNRNHTGSCKHNAPQHHDVSQRHKCKQFTPAKEQPAALEKGSNG